MFHGLLQNNVRENDMDSLKKVNRLKTMKKMKNKTERLKDYLYIVIGCIIAAIAIDVFLVPYKIAPGGLTGLATILFHITSVGIPVGTLILILNVPLFLGGFRFIGKRFIVKTLFSTVLLSAFIDLFEPFTQRFINQYLDKVTDVPYGSNLLLYCVIGGFVMGIGLGLVFRAGATTGGTDLAAKILHRFIPHFTVGQILLVIDGLVVLLAAIAFKSFLLGLYATVAIYISSKVIDTILEGVNYAKAVFIISDQADLISQKVMREIDRGVTGLSGTGMYTGTEKRVLLCVLERTQIPKLKELVKDVDPKAFVVMTDVREVLGEGFKKNE